MMYNPCVFEQLPIFNTFPTSVRNQQLNTCNRAAAAAPVARSNVKFNTVATEEGLLLTLKKPLANRSQYKSELQSRIYEIKNKYSQIPKYNLVSDMWGNQYYVDVTAKIQEKMIEELNSIDMTNFGRRLSKQSFGDYELELNHDGSVLNVSSERDSLNKNLQFGSSLKDFYVKSCTVEDEAFAVLKVAIVLEKPIFAAAAAADATTAPSTGSDSLEKLINWAQGESAVRDNVKQQEKYDQLVGCSSMNECKKIQKKKDQEERNKKEQQEKARRSEIKRQKKLEQFKLRKQQEQEQKAKKEAYETKLIEEQRKKIEAMIQKQVSEEKQQAEIERKRQAAAAEEKQRLELRAKELAEKQKAAEIAQRKANEEAERIKREQMLLEQQEYQRQLVEEERQRKAAQLLSKSEATPVISQSDNEDMDEDMDVDSESDNASTTLRKHSSPILEEVDDEEIDRYNDSISQRKPSNGGYEPIIEDK
ncbi:Actin-like protein 10 [Maudiozyma exigua]|uniref:Actin-like protein 10 n=1 Tax=Maudiozyma exigua TaxID=34358 RepID=A0A9P6W4S5_MAUEX|nr:Actin-like protein 10 [Kazachstania exigua]